MKAIPPHEDGNDLDVEAFSDAAFLVDTDGLIQDVNDLAASLVGYAPHELANQAIDFVLSSRAGERRTTTARVAVVPASDGAFVRHRDGHTIAVAMVLCPSRGGTTLVMMRTTEPARDGLREDDVAQIVHDIKNPLSTIALESELLDHRIAEGELGSLAAAVRRIVLNVGYVDRLVHNLLEVCAMDSGAVKIHRASVDVRELVANVIERSVATRDRGRVVLDAPAPVTLAIDELRIERVVANFLQNALKYAPEPSAVLVRIEALPSCARVSVTDGGPGISPDDQHSLFEKYRRGAASRAQDGCGLGLYLSRRIIELHGGRIGVDSSPGQGSRFYFELPH